MVSKWARITTLSFILLLTIFTRFDNLGFTHFYGDETKTFYIDKTKPALEFFLDQRKGPIQFLISWITEKITGGYNELYQRIPFAIASTLSVILFYFLIKKLFSDKYDSEKIAILGTFLFSINGFFIAFGRTVQYQSFLILFGLTAILLFLYKRPILSGIFIGLSILSHYDAVFYLFPIVYLAAHSYKKDLRNHLYLLLATVLIAAPFYILYLTSGKFQINTADYLSNRITGKNLLPNNSLLTIQVYNPNFLYLVLLSFSSFTFIKVFKSLKNKNYDHKLYAILVWFLVPFFVFQIIFSNPGTHILNYILPLTILAAYGINEYLSSINSKIIKYVSYFFIALSLILIAITQINIFSPTFNTGYPWNQNIGKNEFQLFLYGFPYNRNWNEVNEFLKKQKDFNNFYTNDDTETSEFYLYPRPSYEYNPTYFIDIKRNQQFKQQDDNFEKVFEYNLVKEISNKEGEIIAKIYKRGNRK